MAMNRGDLVTIFEIVDGKFIKVDVVPQGSDDTNWIDMKDKWWNQPGHVCLAMWLGDECDGA